MVDDFYENLTALTDNLSDIVFSRYAEVTKVDGFSVECKENESGVVHINVPIINNFEVEVGDFIILGFVDNDLYNPVALGMLEPRGGGGGDVPIVTAWEQTLSDSKVPSEKLTKNTLDTKVDKETGKGLSTEDYTTSEKTKLAGIESEANKTIVDSSLSSISENPVQNKIIKSAIDYKINISDIIDNLTTNESYKPLSARQGKILKDLIDSLHPNVSNINLSTNKDVLSYYDREVALLIATALNSQNQPVAGVVVTFYKGSTPVGTATTNQQGIAIITYHSSGEGLLTFTAQADNVTSSNIQIADCKYADIGTTDKTANYTSRYLEGSGTATITHNTNDYTITNDGSGTKVLILENLPLTNFTMEADFKPTSGNVGLAYSTRNTYGDVYGVETDLNHMNGWRYILGSFSTPLGYSNPLSRTLTGYNTHLKLIKQESNLTVQTYDNADSTQVYTKSITLPADFTGAVNPGVGVGGNNTGYFKNLKIY